MHSSRDKRDGLEHACGGCWARFFSKVSTPLTVRTFQEELHQFVSLCNSSNSQTVIDLGCGIGALSEYLVRAGLNVIAVDAHAGAIEALRDSIPKRSLKRIQMLCESFWELGRSGLKADALLAVRSLSHGNLKSFREHLETVSHLTREGGPMLLYMTARGDFRSVLGRRIDEITWAPDCGPELDIPHVFPSVDQLNAWLPHFRWVSYREDVFPVPRDSEYFDAYPESARTRMRTEGLVSRHHCLLAIRAQDAHMVARPAT